MKTSFKLLAIIALISGPSALMAQKITTDFVPFATGKQQFRNEIKLNQRVVPLPSSQSFPSAFRNQLPTISPESVKSLTEGALTNPDYNYTMPVVKPGKTTKIMVAELDPNSPYTYNMPVRKFGITGK